RLACSAATHRVDNDQQGPRRGRYRSQRTFDGRTAPDLPAGDCSRRTIYCLSPPAIAAERSHLSRQTRTARGSRQLWLVSSRGTLARASVSKISPEFAQSRLTRP